MPAAAAAAAGSCGGAPADPDLATGTRRTIEVPEVALRAPTFSTGLTARPFRLSTRSISEYQAPPRTRTARRRRVVTSTVLPALSRANGRLHCFGFVASDDAGRFGTGRCGFPRGCADHTPRLLGSRLGCWALRGEGQQPGRDGKCGGGCTHSHALILRSPYRWSRPWSGRLPAGLLRPIRRSWIGICHDCCGRVRLGAELRSPRAGAASRLEHDATTGKLVRWRMTRTATAALTWCIDGVDLRACGSGRDTDGPVAGNATRRSAVGAAPPFVEQVAVIDDHCREAYEAGVLSGARRPRRRRPRRPVKPTHRVDSPS
jgi:hypothetical protein